MQKAMWKKVFINKCNNQLSVTLSKKRLLSKKDLTLNGKLPKRVKLLIEDIEW